MKRTWQGQDGFGLIELAVVIIVIGILMGLAMQSMTAIVGNVRRARTEREMEMLAHAIVGNPGVTSTGVRAGFGYVGDIGAFPPDLDALMTNPGGYLTWNGPYIPPGFVEDTQGFKLDEWGAPYVYGVTTITSTGSGTSIVQRVARATADYLLNQFAGRVTDAAGTTPGTVMADSVDVLITVPNGAGSLVTKLYHPSGSGVFLMDSLPVGQHLLRLVYVPNADTVRRFITVLPRHRPDSTLTYRFPGVYF